MHTLLASTVSSKIITALVNMFIHSVWQGLLLTVAAACILLCMKKRDAVKRYNLLLVVNMVFLLSCIYTFCLQWSKGAGTGIIAAKNRAGNFFSARLSGNLNQLFKFISDYMFAHQQWIFTGWLLVVVYKILYMVAALAYNRRISYRQVSEPDHYWIHRVRQLAKKLRIQKSITLLQSGYCKVPVVTGYLKPVILIPVGLLTHWPADQVEAILLHELAHIRRNDYLVNYIQHLVEIMFFFNPGVWWLSSMLREERENCCDDIALRQTQNRKGLASALISFKEYELGIAAFTTFTGRKNHLLRRVMRILDIKTTTPLPEKLLVVMMAGVLFVMASIVIQTPPAKVLKPSSVNIERGTYLLPALAVIPAASYGLQGGPIKKMRSPAKINPAAGGTLTEPVLPATTGIAVDINILAEQQWEATSRKQVIADRELAMREQAQAETAQELARLDQQQAMKDQQQAMIDQEQSVQDQRQAKLDQEQAAKDQQLAMKSKHDAEKIRLKNNPIK